MRSERKKIKVRFHYLGNIAFLIHKFNCKYIRVTWEIHFKC